MTISIPLVNASVAFTDKNDGQAIQVLHNNVLKAASDLLQFTTERGYKEISEGMLLPLEDFKLKQA